MINLNAKRRDKRKKRVRSKVVGTKDRPRLSVFRSNEHIYAQIVDDEKKVTLVSAGDKEVKVDGKKESPRKAQALQGKLKTLKEVENTKNSKKPENTERGSKKLEITYEVGKLIAKKAAKKKIKRVVFDRSGYKYHGRVASLADGAREGGLKF